MTLPSEADTVSGDLCEEFTLFVVPRRGIRAAYCWYCWQVARSIGPILLRSWQRATLTRASGALVSAAVAATVPGSVVVLLRTFTLQQVPLKTTTDTTVLFVATLAAVVVTSAGLGIAAALRVLNSTARS
ncbi:MAG: hypothetical protein H0T71_16300 [Acidobacteria bacterium]|nr:hypothetical protein [Acidobacteriota bacterium]